MDDEGGSPHLSMSLIYRETQHFHHTPLLTAHPAVMADWQQTSIS